MVIFATFSSILFQLVVAYGLNSIGTKLGWAQGYEIFTMYWVFTSLRYLYSINKYLELLNVVQKEMTDTIIKELGKTKPVEDNKNG